MLDIFLYLGIALIAGGLSFAGGRLYESYMRRRGAARGFLRTVSGVEIWQNGDRRNLYPEGADDPGIYRVPLLRGHAIDVRVPKEIFSSGVFSILASTDAAALDNIQDPGYNFTARVAGETYESGLLVIGHGVVNHVGASDADREDDRYYHMSIETFRFYEEDGAVRDVPVARMKEDVYMALFTTTSVSELYTIVRLKNFFHFEFEDD